MKSWFHRVSARSLLLGGLSLASSCDPVVENIADSQILIVVSVKGVQTGTQVLQVKSSLNGKPDPNGLDITNNTSKFAIQLPNQESSYGQFKLDGFALDTNRCYLANGQVTEQITKDKTYYELELTLLPQAAAKCNLTVTVTGNGTVTSNPAGIGCGGGQSACSYDFPFGTDVVLSGPASLTSYPVWTSGCTPSTTLYQPTCTTKLQKGGTKAEVDFVARACSPDGWCQYHPIGTIQSLGDVWGSGSKDVWIVGNGNTILNTSGGAFTQSATAPFANLSVNQVRGSSATNIYALSNSGGTPGLARYDGTKWTGLPTWPGFPNIDARGLVALPSGDAIVVGYNFAVGGPFAARLSGTSWTTITTGLTATEILNRGWPASDTEVWAGSTTGIWRYDGTKWTKDASPAVQNKNVQFLWGTSATDIWAATSTELFHYDGTSWTAAPVDNGVTISSISNIGGGTGPDVWLASNTAGRLFRYAGGSCSPKCWTQTDLPGVTQSIRAIWGAASNDLYAVGNLGLILRYDGQTWSRSPYARAPLTTGTLTASYGVPNNQNSALQIFGPIDTNLNVDASNITVATGFSTTSQAINAVYGLSANEIMAVGNNGLVMRYNGTSWATIPSGTTNSLTGVFINNSPRFYYISGANGFIARADQTLSGFTVQTKNVPPAPNPNTTTQYLYAMGGSSMFNLYVTSYSGVIYRTTDGVSWNQILPAPNTTETYYVAYYHPTSGRVYLGGTNGQLIYYTGASFQTLSTGTTASIYSMWGTTGTQAMWVGGTGGTLLKFDGTTFTPLKSGVIGTIRTLWGNNLTDVWAAGDAGTILRWKM